MFFVATSSANKSFVANSRESYSFWDKNQPYGFPNSQKSRITYESYSPVSVVSKDVVREY